MRVNEIFYSLQGEGFYVGTPSVFVRFSGCNLRCPFCDTQHTEGREMTEADILQEVQRYGARHVVLTGGEPSLQLTESLVEGLHRLGRYVAVETNGTRLLPAGVDWVTLSPKDAFVNEAAARIALSECHELKVVFTGAALPEYSHIQARHRFLQPCDTGHAGENARILSATIDYCKQHPEWRLSLQTHKWLGIR